MFAESLEGDVAITFTTMQRRNNVLTKKLKRMKFDYFRKKNLGNKRNGKRVAFSVENSFLLSFSVENISFCFVALNKSFIMEFYNEKFLFLNFQNDIDRYVIDKIASIRKYVKARVIWIFCYPEVYRDIMCIEM